MRTEEDMRRLEKRYGELQMLESLAMISPSKEAELKYLKKLLKKGTDTDDQARMFAPMSDEIFRSSDTGIVGERAT